MSVLEIKSPTYFTHNYPATIAIVIFLLVFVGVYTLTPFGLIVFPKIIQFKLALTDAVIATISFLTVFSLFMHKKNGEYWIFWKEILVFFAMFLTSSCLIYFGLFFLSLYFNEPRIHIPFYKSSLHALSICIILSVPLKFIDVLFYLSINKKSINSVPPKNINESIILFKGRNKKEFLYVKPENIIVIKSLGNYLSITYMDENKQVINNMTIRNTIEYAFKLLNSNKIFFKCHRSYIINVDKIDKIYKRSNKYIAKMLYIRNNNIPISINVIQDLLKLKKLHE